MPHFILATSQKPIFLEIGRVLRRLGEADEAVRLRRVACFLQSAFFLLSLLPPSLPSFLLSLPHPFSAPFSQTSHLSHHITHIQWIWEMVDPPSQSVSQSVAEVTLYVSDDHFSPVWFWFQQEFTR